MKKKRSSRTPLILGIALIAVVVIPLMVFGISQFSIGQSDPQTLLEQALQDRVEFCYLVYNHDQERATHRTPLPNPTEEAIYLNNFASTDFETDLTLCLAVGDAYVHSFPEAFEVCQQRVRYTDDSLAYQNCLEEQGVLWRTYTDLRSQISRQINSGRPISYDVVAIATDNANNQATATAWEVWIQEGTSRPTFTPLPANGMVMTATPQSTSAP